MVPNKNKNRQENDEILFKTSIARGVTSCVKVESNIEIREMGVVTVIHKVQIIDLNSEVIKQDEIIEIDCTINVLFGQFLLLIIIPHGLLFNAIFDLIFIFDIIFYIGKQLSLRYSNKYSINCSVTNDIKKCNFDGILYVFCTIIII